MYHVRALVFFVYGWISKGVCQMAPFGIENLLFGGLGGFPPSQPMGIPFGLGGLFGQGQFAPSIAGMPPSMGSFPGGPLPFPLFPMPCEVTCDHGGLFFANINIGQPQRPGMPSGPSGPSGGGMPTGGGAGGMPGRPGGMPGGAPGGMPGARPPTGALPGGGMPTTPRPGAGAGGTQPTRPAPTTMPTRPPGQGIPQQQQPNINAQILYYVPNWAPYPSMSWPPYHMPFYG